MKPNRTYNIILLIISHVYIYSCTYVLLYNVIRYVKTDFFILKDFFLMILLSPFSILFIEGYTLFAFLGPIVLFLVLRFNPNMNILKLYIISAMLIFIFNYILQYINSDNYLEIVVMSYDGELKYEKLFFIIPSLVVTIILNRIIFRNKLFNQ